jgi:hypothetical protein
MATQLYRNRFKTAIDLQDACNLRAIARKLVEAAMRPPMLAVHKRATTILP